jgi:hypothetical protein
VAARLETGLAAHCVDLFINGGGFVQVVPAFGGDGPRRHLLPQVTAADGQRQTGVFQKPAKTRRTGEVIKEDAAVLMSIFLL